MNLALELVRLEFIFVLTSKNLSAFYLLVNEIFFLPREVIDLSFSWYISATFHIDSSELYCFSCFPTQMNIQILVDTENFWQGRPGDLFISGVNPNNALRDCLKHSILQLLRYDYIVRNGIMQPPHLSYIEAVSKLRTLVISSLLKSGVLSLSWMNFRTYLKKYWPAVGWFVEGWTAIKAEPNKIAITIQEVIVIRSAKVHLATPGLFLDWTSH